MDKCVCVCVRVVCGECVLCVVSACVLECECVCVVCVREVCARTCVAVCEYACDVCVCPCMRAGSVCQYVPKCEVCLLCVCWHGECVGVVRACVSTRCACSTCLGLEHVCV